ASLLFALFRVRVSLMAALSAGAGFIFYEGRIAMDSVSVGGSVFLLACGMSALNQLQERHIDARMPRTSSRPLPAGTITPRTARLISMLLLFGSLSLLGIRANPATVLIGASAVLWYNGLYTWLKRKTAFAVIPGSLTGSMGPAMGWAAAGGSLWSPPIGILCLFFYMWQIPHFWLLMIDYGREYEQAGLPSVSRLLRPVQMRRIAAAWVVATGVGSLIVAMGFLPGHAPLGFALTLLSIWMISQMPGLIREEMPDRVRLFQRLNAYMTAVLLLIILGEI
ncbi:MAG: UbiA family prenyltransferase, partial [Thermodesulfovibrionales bacterium]